MRTAGNTYEASKQDEPRDGPRGEARNETRGETLQGHDETREKQPTPTTGDCVFVSTCRERYRDDDTEAV